MDPKTTQFIDVYDVWYKPWWHSTWFYFLVTAIILGICFFLIIVIRRLFVKGKVLKFDQIALLNLQELLEQSYNTTEMLQDTYFKVTMILKVYLSKQYNIALLDKTDKEIVEHIKKFISVDIAATLEEFFDRSFQIKFAQEAVSEKMLKDDILFIQHIIKETSKTK